MLKTQLDIETNKHDNIQPVEIKQRFQQKSNVTML